MKINDGQLDHANRRIAELEKSLRAVQEVCARRLDMLSFIRDCRYSEDFYWIYLRLSNHTWDELERETDENEVQP